MKLQFGNEKKTFPMHLHTGKTLLHFFNPTSRWIWYFSEHLGLLSLTFIELCHVHSQPTGEEDSVGSGSASSALPWLA